MTDRLIPEYIWASAVGQDSHRFLSREEQERRPLRQLRLAGVAIPGETALAGNSDADVVLHALTNAVSGLSGINILGSIADRLCHEDGITDSAVYLQEALNSIGLWRISHVSISVECRKPRLADYIDLMRENIAGLLDIDSSQVGLTATSGEGLTAFGKGEGIQAFCIISGYKHI